MDEKPMPAHADEVDLRELFKTIWRGRWLIILVASLFTLAGTAYVLLAPDWYKAELVLVPSSPQSATGGALGGLGGLSRIAGLAGINVPNAGDPQPVAVLKSADLARDFITAMNAMPALLQGVRQGSRPLDIRDAVKVFDKKVRTVSEDTRTGLVTLSIRWRDPDTAALWANTLATRLNDRLRQQAQTEAERNVAYLKNEIANTSIVSLQQSIGSLLESEMQRLMLARGNEQFAFKVVDPAVPPIEPDVPKPILIVAASFLAGGFLSILFLVVRRTVQARPREQR
jgi:uncharacterized protein involved in exopolysaccharide biosynthesis